MIFVKELGEELANAAAARVTSDHDVRHGLLHLEAPAVKRALMVAVRRWGWGGRKKELVLTVHELIVSLVVVTSAPCPRAWRASKSDSESNR